jgi:hypothetical protein
MVRKRMLSLGAYFEITALVVLLLIRPPNSAEWISMAIYPLVPIAYGASVTLSAFEWPFSFSGISN